MKCIKVFGYVLLALLFVSTVPYAAEAGSVKVRPQQFKPVNTADPDNSINPSELGGGGPASYYAVVKLPVGKRVKALLVYYSSNSFDVTTCSLLRVRWGFGTQPLANATIIDDTDWQVVVYLTELIAYSKIKAGYTYWVGVDVGNGHMLHGVEVKYE